MSNIPKGYKQTEVGVIPEDWEVVCLGEMTIKVGSGITPTGGERVYKKEGRPFLRSQNVGWGHLLMDDIAFIDDTIHETFRASEILDNDVFLNITGASIGRSAVADSRVEGGNVNQHVCIIRTVNDKLNPHFLNFILLSKVGQKQIDSFQAGGNRQGLNFGQIRSFKIPLPTKAEQTAIAEALSDADALISRLENLIAKKRNIKQGAMQELLTGKKRLPGFSGKWEVKKGYKQTEVGVIPEDWEVRKLGEITRIFVGRDLKEVSFSSYQDNIYQYPVYSNTVDNDGRYGYYNISEYQGDSLTIVGRGVGLGTAFKRNGSYGAIGRLLVLFPDRKVDTGYLTEYINHRVKIFEESSGIPQLTGISIAKYNIPLPPTKAEQTAIAQILSDMDAEIEQLEQKLDKYRMIKQGMMQELLTGKTRLV